MKKTINFNQKFEPKGNKVIHGAGQSLEAFSKYWDAVGDYKPVIYMTYAKIPKISKWVNKIKIESKRFPNLMLQIGLKLLDSKGNDKTEDILSGGYDKDLADFLKTIKEFKDPTFIRIGYEFDKEGKYNPLKFVKSWRYIVNMFREAKINNIATVWCACPYNGTEPVEPYYPGDDYVDWFGIDVFSARHFKDSSYEPVENFLKLAKKHKKPVMVGESSPARTGVDKGKESWDEWFKPYFKWINNHPIIKAFCYINWDWGKDWKQPEWLNGRIEENEEVRKRYIKELSKPIYIHNKKQGK